MNVEEEVDGEVHDSQEEEGVDEEDVEGEEEKMPDRASTTPSRKAGPSASGCILRLELGMTPLATTFLHPADPGGDGDSDPACSAAIELPKVGVDTGLSPPKPIFTLVFAAVLSRSGFLPVPLTVGDPGRPIPIPPPPLTCLPP